MRGSQDSSGVAFRSFLSHRYQSPRINECFFQILSADANPQFAVDPGTIATSVTRLERLIRDADAFIGIYPFPEDTDVTVERLKSESRYFRLELDLAERASKPAMVFVDRRKRQLRAYGPRNAVASRRSENEGGAHQIATGRSNHPRRIWRDEISAYVGISGPGSSVDTIIQSIDV